LERTRIICNRHPRRAVGGGAATVGSEATRDFCPWAPRHGPIVPPASARRHRTPRSRGRDHDGQRRQIPDSAGRWRATFRGTRWPRRGLLSAQGTQWGLTINLRQLTWPREIGDFEAKSASSHQSSAASQHVGHGSESAASVRSRWPRRRIPSPRAQAQRAISSRT
jgi:hypothetical protein